MLTLFFSLSCSLEAKWIWAQGEVQQSHVISGLSQAHTPQCCTDIHYDVEMSKKCHNGSNHNYNYAFSSETKCMAILSMLHTVLSILQWSLVLLHKKFVLLTWFSVTGRLISWSKTTRYSWKHRHLVSEQLLRCNSSKTRARLCQANLS